MRRRASRLNSAAPQRHGSAPTDLERIAVDRRAAQTKARRVAPTARWQAGKFPTWSRLGALRRFSSSAGNMPLIKVTIVEFGDHGVERGQSALVLGDRGVDRIDGRGRRGHWRGGQERPAPARLRGDGGERGGAAMRRAT
jgi:hypothetical protein